MLATVAVPGPARRLFTYSVPEALRERCVRGVRVLVPFGRRRLAGCVVEVSDQPPSADSPYVVRPLEEILDDTPPLDEGLLDLTRWAADYYGASWGDLIRAALPGMQIPLRRLVAPTPAGLEALGAARTGAGPAGAHGLGAASLVALEAVARASRGARSGFVPIGQLRRRSGATVGTSVLQRLARGGWLEMRGVPARKGLGRRLTEWVLPASEAPAGSESAVRAPGPRQAGLLRRLEASGDGVPAADLLKATGTTRASLRALESRGLVRLESRPAPQQRPPALLTPIGAPERVTPTAEQQAAIDAIEAGVRERRFETFLLFGVTSSGKTEVYLRAVEAAVALGRQAIYLVPEIGLTPLLARRMQARFGEVLALLHSGLTVTERASEWRRVREGRVKVVLGARSAVFAPLRDPGLVIVDEEHDASYKQDEHPRYSGRDLAIVRAQRIGAPVVLGSATPSMESYHNALRRKYRLLTLRHRVAGAVLPLVHRIDMRREFEETGTAAPLSRCLHAALRERLERKEQSLILLNRRGFSTFVLCRACGETLECPRCSIALTLHLRDRRLRCHYCQESRAVPASCPECGSGHLHFGGTGTEKLEETLRSLFPQARVARMDRDTVRGRGAVEDLLGRVERGEIDILLGTQMIAKGHDFPNVTLVGVLAADALLGLPDFRAGERTFQLLAQMAGRSGRRERPGEVIVQAYDPEHHAVRAACEHDFEAFARAELVYRKTLRYPPFSALALLVFRDRIYERALEQASSIATRLRSSRQVDLQVLGPAPAPLERLRGVYRVQVLLKGSRRAAVRQALEETDSLIERLGVRKDSVTVDVDPASTL